MSHHQSLLARHLTFAEHNNLFSSLFYISIYLSFHTNTKKKITKREKKNNVKKIIAIYKLLKELKIFYAYSRRKSTILSAKYSFILIFLVKCLFLDKSWMNMCIMIFLWLAVWHLLVLSILGLITHFSLMSVFEKIVKKSLEIDDFSSVFDFYLISRI